MRDTSTNRHAFLMGNTMIEKFGENKRAEVPAETRSPGGL